MKYAVLVNDTQGNTNWNARHAVRPEIAAKNVWNDIQRGNSLIMSNQRPIQDARHDGMPVIYNPAHVVNVVAYPAC